MKASELIQELQNLIAEHGDLDVVDDLSIPAMIVFSAADSEDEDSFDAFVLE